MLFSGSPFDVYYVGNEFTMGNHILYTEGEGGKGARRIKSPRRAGDFNSDAVTGKRLLFLSIMQRAQINAGGHLLE